jgi:arylsulfatase A-like enzyme
MIVCRMKLHKIVPEINCWCRLLDSLPLPTSSEIAMKHSLLFLLLLSLLSACSSKPTTAIPQEKYNVLFISIDDLNDWTGCLGGHPQAKTPYIDKLARQGTLFTRAYCPATACLPSRAATMTGVAPYTSGCYENQNNQQWQYILKPMADTLPGHMRANGYYAAGAGKIFHHYQNDPDSWDDYYPSKRLQFPRIHHPKKQDLTEFTGKEGVPKWWYSEFKWGPLNMNEKNTGDNHSVQFVIDQLNQQKKGDKPFFLTCGIYRPHVPWFAPKKYFDMFPIDKIQLPPNNPNDFDDIPGGKAKRAPGTKYHEVVGRYSDHRAAVQAYLASIAYMDALVGRLMRALEKSGHADNTIVVFWSDHGWHMGEKDLYRKFTLWEESCRVPLILRLPKKLQDKYPQGVNCGRVVNLIDIFPTLNELCGLPQPRQKFDGNSLLPLLIEPTTPWDQVSISQYSRDNYSLRTEQYRYIRYTDGKEELYDHDNDPYEWNNLAELPAYAKIKAQLAARLPRESRPYQKTPLFDWKSYHREVIIKAEKEKAFDRVKPEWD